MRDLWWICRLAQFEAKCLEWRIEATPLTICGLVWLAPFWAQRMGKA